MHFSNMFWSLVVAIKITEIDFTTYFSNQIVQSYSSSPSMQTKGPKKYLYHHMSSFTVSFQKDV